MKTRKQKVITILASVFLLASFLCFPVSAADDYYTAVFHYPYLGVDDTTFEDNYFGFCLLESSLNDYDWDTLRRPYTDFYWSSGDSEDLTGYGYHWLWPSGYNNQGYISFYLGSSSFGISSYVPEDTIWVDPVDLLLIFPDAYSGVFQYRFAFRDVSSGNDVGSVVGYSEWVSYRAASYESWSEIDLSIARTAMTITKGGSYDGLAFFIEFFGTSMNQSMGLAMDEYGVSVNYGKGHSPNYPVYNAPSGSDEIGGLTTQEDELLEDTEEGSYLANEYFQHFNSVYTLGYFPAGLVAITNVMGSFINNIPGFTALMNVSLSLGLFATLLGLAAAVFGAADRRAAAKSRSANTSSKKRK